jgi:putative ABC transport system permease protein
MRKPSRTVIIGLILFAMANLVLAAITIKGAVNQSMTYAKSSLGGTVYLQADMAKLRTESESSTTEDSDGSSGPASRPPMTRPTIAVSLVEDIADSDYVRDYTYSISSSANASGFTVVENEETEMRGAFNQMRGTPPSTTDDSDSTESNGELPIFMQRGDLTISGINSYAFISEVKNGTMTLADGTYFDEKTDDKIIISSDLANQNDLAVGDQITLIKMTDESQQVLEIIGIYDVTSDNFSANMIYMNIASAAKFLTDDDYNDGDFNVESVQYFLTNAENADQFIEQATTKHSDLADSNLTLAIDTSAYEKMVQPIESVGGFATTILWVVIVASVVIIALIVTINVKDRRYEMGVLISLGASKANVLGQILLELVIVGSLAFALSIGTSQFLARALGDSLLSSQIAASQQQSQENFGRPGASVGGSPNRGGQMAFGSMNQTNSDVETIDSIDVSAQLSDYLILFAAGYAVIIVALIVPAINVLRFQPKTILAGKE